MHRRKRACTRWLSREYQSDLTLRQVQRRSDGSTQRRPMNCPMCPEKYFQKKNYNKISPISNKVLRSPSVRALCLTFWSTKEVFLSRCVILPTKTTVQKM